MRNMHEIGNNVYLSLRSPDVSEKTSGENQVISGLMREDILDNDYPLFGKIFVVGEALTLDEVPQQCEEYGAEVFTALEYSKFNQAYWISSDLHNSTNQVLLYHSQRYGRRPLSIDYSLDEGLDDLKNVIVKLFVLSRIYPICIQVNTPNFDHVQLAIDMSLIIMVLSILFEDMIVAPYFETKAFHELILCTLSEKYSDIPGYDECIKQMNLDSDDFSSRRFNMIFSHTREIYAELVDPELSNQVIQNSDFVNAFKSPLAPQLVQSFEENVSAYWKKSGGEIYDGNDNAQHVSASASVVVDAQKKDYRAIKITTLLDASRAIHQTCTENTIPSLQKLKLIMMAVRNTPWMYLNTGNSINLRKLRIAASTRNAVVLGPNSVRSTAIDMLEKIKDITQYIQNEIEIIEKSTIRLNGLPSLPFLFSAPFSENVSSSKKLKFVASFYGNRSESKKLPNRVRDMIISDNDKGAIMLGMLPICNIVRQRHEGVEILREFSQAQHPLGLVVSVLEDFELAGEGLKYPTVSENFWRQHGVMRRQICLPDNINEIHKFSDDILQDIFDVLEMMYEYHSQGKGIYIHCKAGRGRSLSIINTFIALYLIDDSSYTIAQRARGAHQIIKRKRRVADSYERKGLLLEALLSDALRRKVLCSEETPTACVNDAASTSPYAAPARFFREHQKQIILRSPSDDSAENPRIGSIM